ncbi:MAG: hypothetical protein GXO88_00500 [Chlorobi bacterium]|nr:hypothetical protein [Chlorobiota bacterium]
MYYNTMHKRQFKPLFGLSILLFAFIISLASCRKERVNNLPIVEPLSIDEVLYDPDFNWSSTKVVDLKINGIEREVVNITSLDGQRRYHRGLFLGDGNDYNVKISLPNTVKQLMINQDTVSVSSPIIHTIS